MKTKNDSIVTSKDSKPLSEYTHTHTHTDYLMKE